VWWQVLAADRPQQLATVHSPFSCKVRSACIKWPVVMTDEARKLMCVLPPLLVAGCCAGAAARHPPTPPLSLPPQHQRPGPSIRQALLCQLPAQAGCSSSS
jgi:hypothetical protein